MKRSLNTRVHSGTFHFSIVMKFPNIICYPTPSCGIPLTPPTCSSPSWYNFQFILIIVGLKYESSGRDNFISSFCGITISSFISAIRRFSLICWPSTSLLFSWCLSSFQFGFIHDFIQFEIKMRPPRTVWTTTVWPELYTKLCGISHFLSPCRYTSTGDPTGNSYIIDDNSVPFYLPRYFKPKTMCRFVSSCSAFFIVASISFSWSILDVDYVAISRIWILPNLGKSKRISVLTVTSTGNVSIFRYYWSVSQLSTSVWIFFKRFPHHSVIFQPFLYRLMILMGLHLLWNVFIQASYKFVYT